MRCDALGNLTQTRTKVPQKELTTGLYSFLIRSRAIPPVEAEITGETQPCWERTSWDSSGLVGCGVGSLRAAILGRNCERISLAVREADARHVALLAL